MVELEILVVEMVLQEIIHQQVHHKVIQVLLVHQVRQLAVVVELDLVVLLAHNHLTQDQALLHL